MGRALLHLPKNPTSRSRNFSAPQSCLARPPIIDSSEVLALCRRPVLARVSRPLCTWGTPVDFTEERLFVHSLQECIHHIGELHVVLLMADDSYYRLYAVVRTRDNFDDVFRSTLEDVAGKVDLSHVKSCLVFGPGGGHRELAFARRLLPNLRSFIAIEPDLESTKVLRTNFQEGQLPGSDILLTITKWCHSVI